MWLLYLNDFVKPDEACKRVKRNLNILAARNRTFRAMILCRGVIYHVPNTLKFAERNVIRVVEQSEKITPRRVAVNAPTLSQMPLYVAANAPYVVANVRLKPYFWLTPFMERAMR